MFQTGDELRYTGAYRNVCEALMKESGREGWIFVRGGEGLKVWDSNTIIYAMHPKTIWNKPSTAAAFYFGDMELVPQGPEPYEEWFK